MLASRSALAAATCAGVPWSRTTSLPESASEKRTTMPPCLAVSSWILLPFGPIRAGKSLRSTASSSLTRLAFASGTVERARQGPCAHGHEIVGVPSYQLLEQGADLLLSGGRVGRRAAQLRHGRAVLRLGHLEARRRRQQNVADLHSSGQTRDTVTVRGAVRSQRWARTCVHAFAACTLGVSRRPSIRMASRSADLRASTSVEFCATCGCYPKQVDEDAPAPGQCCRWAGPPPNTRSRKARTSSS